MALRFFVPLSSRSAFWLLAAQTLRMAAQTLQTAAQHLNLERSILLIPVGSK
jgi:hypothetical protein